MSNFKKICPAAKALMACCRRADKRIRHVVCMKVFLVYFVSKEYTVTCSGPPIYKVEQLHALAALLPGKVTPYALCWEGG